MDKTVVDKDKLKPSINEFILLKIKHDPKTKLPIKFTRFVDVISN